MRIAELVGHLERRGARLVLRDDGDIEFVGPNSVLTDEIRQEIRRRKTGIAAFLGLPREGLPAHEQAALRIPSIAELLGQLADCGLWLSLEGEGGLDLHASDDADLDRAEGVVDQLHYRVDEVLSFLAKGADEMTDAELRALGFRRREPGARILHDPADPEPRAWTPPPDWRAESDSEGARP